VDKLLLKKPEEIYVYSSEKNKIDEAGIYLVGFEFDGTVCFRKGACLGPDAFRDVSEGIEAYSPYLGVDLEEDNIPLFDLGNLAGEGSDQSELYLSLNNSFEQLTNHLNLENNNQHIITLGGEHSISLVAIKKYLDQYPNLVLIHLDAHADLRDGYLGNYYSHASIIRRSLDHFGPGHQLIQYGIRSGTRDEYNWMKENKSICQSRQEFFERVKSIPENTPVYVTLDLDFFDPSFLPGTGTPEAGGEDFHTYVSMLKVLKDKKFVGGDIVELAPEIDPTNNSAVFATKVLREMICALSLSRGFSEVKNER